MLVIFHQILRELSQQGQLNSVHSEHSKQIMTSEKVQRLHPQYNKNAAMRKYISHPFSGKKLGKKVLLVPYPFSLLAEVVYGIYRHVSIVADPKSRQLLSQCSILNLCVLQNTFTNQ